jgi:hypothetical protein
MCGRPNRAPAAPRSLWPHLNSTIAHHYASAAPQHSGCAVCCHWHTALAGDSSTEHQPPPPAASQALPAGPSALTMAPELLSGSRHGRERGGARGVRRSPPPQHRHLGTLITAWCRKLAQTRGGVRLKRIHHNSTVMGPLPPPATRAL